MRRVALSFWHLFIVGAGGLWFGPLLSAATPTPDADDGGLILPPGFRAQVVADQLMRGRGEGNTADRLRFIAVSNQGVVYAKTLRGGIFALRDRDGDGRLEEQREFGSGGGTGIALKDNWLYHSSNSAVYRYRLDNAFVPSSEPERIVKDLLEQRAHAAKSFAFDAQGRLLVEVGAPYNAYSENDRKQGAKGLDATELQKVAGGFFRFDAARRDQTYAEATRFSTGHRHSLALARQPQTNEFFMVMMGRDNLNIVDPEHYDELDNAERVAEEMHQLREGMNLGWPYTYWDPIKNARMVAPEFGGDNRKRADPNLYAAPVLTFPGHWAPLQMMFYTGEQFPQRYRNGAFIAFHGSWNRAPRPQEGFQIAFVPFNAKGMPEGQYETFAISSTGKPWRMGGVALAPDGSLYISDTDVGRIWRIVYTGEPSARVAARNAVSAPTNNSSHPGKVVYDQLCGACHLPDGTGSPPLQPGLVGSAVVRGDGKTLINVVLRGPAAALPADRPRYNNQMPAYDFLSDTQIADVLSYIRQQFGGGASSITASSVGSERGNSK